MYVIIGLWASASKSSIRRFVITEKVNAGLAQCLNSVLNVKAVVAAFNQEKALVGAFSVITNLRMELFEALDILHVPCPSRGGCTLLPSQAGNV